jgi:sugar lactone lactonase YvrE
MGFKFRRRMALFAVCIIISGLVSGVLPYGEERAYAGTGGEIETVAGGSYGESGDGDLAVNAELSSLSAIAVDRHGNLYIADTDNNRIRKVDAGTRLISTVAGSGDYGYSGDGNAALDAQMRAPSGVAVDEDGNLYIADKYNNRIRKVDKDGIITTVAGTGANGDSGDNVSADAAELSNPSGVALDGHGNLYIADTSNHRIRKVDAAGIITTIAGSEDSGYSGDGELAVAARLYYPNDVALDRDGNLYIADTYNNRIRKVDTSGFISTVAGSTGVDGYSGDGGPAVSAQLNEPEGLAVDDSGNLYIADTDNNRVRKVIPNGNISTIAGTGVSGYSGDGGTGTLAQLDAPAGLALDSGGNLYIADKYNYALRKQAPYIPSNTTSLSDIALSSGTLSPAFAVNTTIYTANVVNGVSSIRVTPTTTDNLMTVKVNGENVASGAQSGDINLDVGENTITLAVLAEDGITTRTYTINVERLRSSNANLSQLTLSTGALSPVFASNTTIYSVDATRSALTVTPSPADPLATVKVNGTPVENGTASQSISLDVGSNTITIAVTAQDGTTTKLYTLNITRSISANADLSGLTLSSGTLSPAFDSETIGYTASVGNNVSSITVMPTAADGISTVTVNSVPAASGVASAALPLNVGSNVILVEVTAENGTPKLYTITVTRAASSNADLSDLTLSSGTLLPAFIPDTYKASVGHQVSSVTVTPTVSDTANATVTVSLYSSGGALVSGPDPVASGTASAALALEVGHNTITIAVTAEDGTLKTYTITVTRGASSNADLTNLTLSSGTLTPAFGGTYTANVGHAVSSITVTPTLADSGNSSATVSVYDGGGTRVSGPHAVGSGAASTPLPLDVGNNVISVLVTAQDGSTRMYTVTVTRAAASSNPNLSGLTLSSGMLNPAFEPDTTGYTATVGNNVNSVTVTMEKSDADRAATTTSIYNSAGTLINGPFALSSGTAAFSLPLNAGSNEYSIILRSQDGMEKTYTLTITRTVSANADLSGLTLSTGTLSPSFVPGTTGYTSIVGNSVSSITVTPTAADGNATVSVNGKPLPSGAASESLPLIVGSTNEIIVVVTAQDGTTTKTYTISVTRARSGNADLNDLTLSSGVLTPSFIPNTFKASVDYQVDSISVTPTVADMVHATVTVSLYSGSDELVDGPHSVTSGMASPALPLSVGSSTIMVLVTAEDETTKTYTVTVTRGASSHADLSDLTLSSGTLVPAFAGTYTANVGNAVSSVTVTPTLSNAADSSITASVYDSGGTLVSGPHALESGTASAPLPLEVGNTIIAILVTAQDGSTRTYKIVITRAAPPYTGGGSGGGGAAPVANQPPAASKPVINLNGQKLELADIDTKQPFVTLEATPVNGVVVAAIPASILSELAARNADFYLALKTPYGSYQVPANLAGLIPELPAMLAKTKLQAEDVSFRITLADKSGDKSLQAAIANALPNAQALGPIVDFHIDVVHTETNLTIGTADKFAQALVRWIPLSSNPNGLPKLGGAFRVHEATKKLEFVPARMLQQDGVWYAAIHSYTNSVYVAAANAVSFGDVKTHWSKAAVELAAAKGLVGGIGGGQFAPDRAVTRAEFTAMLVRTLGSGTSAAHSAPYADVAPDAWYSGAVAAAKELGLLDFVSGNSFKPNQALTREEMASMLAATIALHEPQLTQEAVSLDGYMDIGTVDAAYLESVRLMVKLQIMKGTSEDAFSPKGITTRAQAAVVFIRMLQQLGLIDQ